MKTKSILLLIGGIVQALLVALHVAMAFQTPPPAPTGLAPATWTKLQESMQIFNGTVIAAILCFAYISLFKRVELLSTSLGRTVCAFISLLYVQRIALPMILRGFERGFDPGFGSLLIGVAAVYAFAAIPARGRSATPIAT